MCGGMLFSCADQPTVETPPAPSLSVTSSDADIDITKPVEFTSDDTSVLAFNVAQNNGEYKVEAEEGATWIVVTKSDTEESFTIAVAEYTQAEAVAANFESRSAVVTVTSGKADPVKIDITQSAPVKKTLTVNPVELVFEPNVSTMTVEISVENILIRNVKAGNIDKEKYPWIKTSVLRDNILTVNVETLAFIEGHGDSEPRRGEVTLNCSELPGPVIIPIIQKPLIMMDLSGSWEITAGEAIRPNGLVESSANPVGKILTATYNAERGSFTFSGITYMKSLAYGHTKDDLGRWTGGIYQDVEMTAGIVLRSTTDGKVTFTTMDETGLTGVDYLAYGQPQIDLEDTGNDFVDYRNMRDYGASKTITAYDIPFDKTAGVITFPTDAIYGFGSLRYEIVDGQRVYVDDRVGNAATYLFRGLVLTKIAE
jgi:hypothetical protein